MAISRVFDIASRSLGVYQRALDVTSNNVANTNNPDYTRQRVVLGSERSEVLPGGEFGTGVKIDDITRVKDNMTDTQIRSYNQKYSDVDKRSQVLGQVESLFSEPSDLGLSSLISSFYSSWDELASTPNSTPLRNNVIQAADRLSSKIQNIYDGLDTVRSNLKSEVDEKVVEINSTVSEIQDLNKQIKTARVTNQSVNDLLDRRDKKINDLSKLVSINVSTDDKGSTSISIGGVFAADEYSATKFTASLSGGKISLTTEDGTAAATLTGGELYANIDLYNNQLTDYQNSIDTIATTITNSVNAQHKLGFRLDGSPGIDFFSYSAGNLTFDRNTNNIAASSTGNAGDSGNAIAIAKISDQPLIGGKTISEYYNSFISGIATEKSTNDQSSQSNQLVLDQLNMQKSSYSGVSIDEEMTNVIKYQKSYDASAKLIKVADEMLDTLINMV